MGLWVDSKMGKGPRAGARIHSGFGGSATLALLFALSLLSGPALACRYNVRDVGFVDVETAPYHFYAFVSPETPAKAMALLRETSAVVLRDCNVECEVVPTGGQTNPRALEHLPPGTGSSLPHAILVSPEGHVLPLPLAQPPEPLRESLTSVLRDVASSPKREELLAAASRAFAAVLLIEGDDADANQRARQAIARAIETVHVQMRSMPKAIAEAPAMVVLEAAALASERILLWSLGLDTARNAQPRAAVVYGRARWMGPLMNGDEISECNLAGLLSVIGADCECGLDVAWTLGTRLPVRWDEARHAQVAKALGLDPESPLVKLEVSRIVARSGAPRAPSEKPQTVVLSTDPRPGTTGVPGGALPGSGPGRGVGGGATASPEMPAGSDPVAGRAWLTVGVIAFAVVCAGLLLLWRARRRRAAAGGPQDGHGGPEC